MSRRRNLLRVAIILVVFVTLSGLAIALWAQHAILTVSEPVMYRDATPVPGRPVAIVFGAKAWSSGPSSVLKDRLDAGIRLYRLGTVKKLLLSGDHGRHEYGEVNTMRRYALERGVEDVDIFLDHAGFRTYDTLYRARDVFGLRSAVLVTSEFHLPRALYTGKRLGLDVVGLVSDARTYRSWLWNDCREFLARTLAWVQVNVTRPMPRHLGPAIDITGDGRATHDE